MAEKFNSSQPIYLQIVEKICRMVVRNDIQGGEKLSSVRDMAIKMGVNPNTVQRAYQELERKSVIETKRGQGSFVVKDRIGRNVLRDELKKQYVFAFITDMQEMGFTSDEIIQGVKEYLDQNDVKK